MRKAGIICTIGPASRGINILKTMAAAGMDVARLNFSHGSHSQHREAVSRIRSAGRRLRILQDLEGYRVRIGRLRNGGPLTVKKGRTYLFVQKDTAGHGDVIPFDSQCTVGSIPRRGCIYVDDGKIAFRVKGRGRKGFEAEALADALIKEKKGINIPGAKIVCPAISEKDREDMDFGIGHRVDYVAQSFVRNRNDVLNIRRYIKPRHPSCRIISKIESREGISNIDEIIEASDGIMIARGDMGISIPVYEVPFVQKEIIRKCNRKAKFVITATQMLDNMIDNPQPTRAEVSDIANAVLDGTDFVMLSGETAAGRYPVESVRMMRQIVEFTERRAGKGRRI